MTWKEVIKEIDRGIVRSELDHGLTWTPDPKATDAQNVRDYVRAFGWRGVGLNEVARVTCSDRRHVRTTLVDMVADGELTVTETDTRGPKASKRKTYWTSGEPLVVGLSDADWERLETLEGACGGGRKRVTSETSYD